MPRSNHSRRRGRPSADEAESDLSRLTTGWRRSETRRGREWNVQPVGSASAVKSYTCPGCAGLIVPGVAHLVVWRADGILGDDADLAARRHWHTDCWRIA